VPDADIDDILDGHPRPSAYHRPTTLSPFTRSQEAALDPTNQRNNGGYQDEDYGPYDDGDYSEDSDGGRYIQGCY
jgi:hypothetical protein